MTKKFIYKRNGQKVEFLKARIENVVSKALGETSESIPWEKYENLIDEICESVESGMDVDTVSDIVEMLLMKYGLFNTAKAYILYRAGRDLKRKGLKESFDLLSEEFLSPYKHATPPMTQLGELVYYRTYSRHLHDQGRKEYWWETVRRAVEYNCSLAKTSRQEAETLFHNVFYLKQFLSGRSFWVGNTEVAKKYPMANYNCSFSVIDEFENFRDIFYLLMIGSGAGVRALKSDVAKLPKIRTDLEVINISFKAVPKNQRCDNTSLTFYPNHDVKITVGDSKEGWVQALDYLLKIHWSKEFIKVKKVFIDYSNVRPKGERLKTFGGTASGHEALLEMFEKIDKVLKKDKTILWRHLSSTDALDIANMIGEGVVVGGKIYASK